jgi:caa(3)-type oxidase subunit IV
MAEESPYVEEAHHIHYVKVWGVLVALLTASVIGPMFGHPHLTLFTAFGIAIIKAYMVARNFMHLSFEKRFITYVLVTCLVFMFLFFAGTAPDVMKPSGRQWEKPSWLAAEATEAPAHGESHH